MTQLKLGIEAALASTVHNSMAQYSIFASCNKCAGVHEMGISITVETAPLISKASATFTMAKAFQKASQVFPALFSRAI